MAIYGYCRVSTDSQSNDKFIKPLVEAGVPVENIVCEVISGTKSWKKRELGKLVSKLKDDDKIIVPELSRLGRGAADVLSLRDHLIENNLTVETLKEGYRIGKGMRSSDKMMITVMAAVNEMERDYISDRTKEGLAHAVAQGKSLGGDRTNGKRLGGRTTHEVKHKVLKALKAGGSIHGTAKRYQVSRTSIYKWKKEAGI